ncbi:MAG TPA: DUF3489 domain-containing protein [Roseiarcus sp.]|nr:DUF3489 domain-containing protein [Roseiarcus sp.]
MSNSANAKSKRRKAALRQATGRKSVGRGRKPTYASSSAVRGQLSGQAPRSGSKLAKVIELLNRREGVGVAELTSTTNWLPHTARAALTGLRKRGFQIERFRSEGQDSHYRLATAPKMASGKA